MEIRKISETDMLHARFHTHQTSGTPAGERASVWTHQLEKATP